ncbi:hypothetical protein AU378_14815 [Chryseobacterium kwangjuense]|uniref:Uncharacterized protein n=1 Tax=Chryseobacterium kwangjuense TaxID=267125 RepID=A0A135W7U3_9FLAO|nr:hypothetical protein AU378_14815 [Chryseobacterium kwangjuense]
MFSFFPVFKLTGQRSALEKRTELPKRVNMYPKWIKINNLSRDKKFKIKWLEAGRGSRKLNTVKK